MVKGGFRVLAIDFRGRGQSRGGAQTKTLDDGLRFDVLSAVRYLRNNGAKTVSVIGASFGGRAAAEASVEAEPVIILDGPAHAQYIFETEQGERLMREILRFLSSP